MKTKISLFGITVYVVFQAYQAIIALSAAIPVIKAASRIAY